MEQSNTATTCARHPKVITGLRCASCNTPICPRCLVHTPVGAKCKSCASGTGGTLFRPTPVQAACAALVALVAGAVAGLAVEFDLGFFTIFLAFAYGAFAGEMVLRASRRKHGLKMEVITGAMMVAGAIAGRVLVAATILPSMANAKPPLGLFNVLLSLVSPSPIPLISLAVATAAAVSRIRYL